MLKCPFLTFIEATNKLASQGCSLAMLVSTNQPYSEQGQIKPGNRLVDDFNMNKTISKKVVCKILSYYNLLSVTIVRNKLFFTF